MTRRQLLWSVGAGLVALLVVIVVTAVLTTALQSTAIRGTQKTNTVKTDKSAETLRLVKDCVTPGGACYERGQSQTAEAVGSLNEGTKVSAAAAAACAAQREIQEAPSVKSRTTLILRCMNGTLSKAEGSRP